MIIVIDEVWDSSTWMAIEADTAEQELKAGGLRGLFYINPGQRTVDSSGMLRYLRKELPTDLDEAIRVLHRHC